jgi:O-antigen/teichoic acid export membrane protein
MSSGDRHDREERTHATAKRRLGQGTAITWLAWIAGRALALATLVLLTQALPADDLGALLAALAAGVLGATLATGGLPDATTRSAILEADSGFGRGDIHLALFRFAATCPAILALVFAIVSRKAGALDWSLLTSSCLLAVTQGGTSIVASVFRARGQAGRYALVTNLITSIGRTGVGIVALAAGLSANIVLWAFVLLNVGVIAGAWEVAVRRLPSTTSANQKTASLHLGGAVWSLLQNLDVVVVGLVVGATGAGTYGVALRLAEFSLLILVAVGVLYLPEAARLAHARRGEELTELYRTSSRWCALISLPIGGAGFVVAPDLAQLLMPDHASAATTVLRILLPAYAFQGALGLAYPTAVALGADRAIRLTALATIPALIAVTVLFAELWGLTGAATATLVAFVGLTVWWVAQTREALGELPFDRLYARAVASAVGSSASAGLAALLTRDETPLVSIAFCGSAAVVSWLVLVRLVGAISAPELRSLTRLGQRSLRLSRA